MNDITKICATIAFVFLVMAGCTATVAKAHTGSVTCDSTGIVFHYNNNFSHDTTVTQYINGVQHQVVVNAYKSLNAGYDAPASYVVVKATWTDGNAIGNIPLTELTCPYDDTITVCQGTPVVNTVYTPGPATVQYVPYETTTYIDRWHTKIKKITHTKIKWKTHIIFIEKWKPGKKHNTPGVAG